MKKLFFVCSLLLLFASQSIYSQMAFNFDGERLKYRAKYGFIKGGEVVITSKKIKYNQEDCYDVKIDMYAIGLVDDIFHFHDIFSSIFSVSTLKPYKFIRDAHEGKYEQYEVVTYYNDYIESTVTGKVETKGRYYDLVSSIFALRCYNWSTLKTNDILSFPIYFDEKIVNTKVKYLGKKKLKMNGKTYNCQKFQPIFDGVKMFSKKGVQVYFTDDYNRKPVLIQVNFKVGSFKVEIDE